MNKPNIETILKHYSISKNGIIKNIKTNRIMKQHVANDYYRVSLFRRYKYAVHRLVALAYLENKNNLPVVNHKDCNKLNNNVKNLEWCTISFNTQHAYDNMRMAPRHGIFNGNHKLSIQDCIEIKRLCKLGVSTKIIGELYGTTSGHVSRINTGKRRGHGT
jgi:HNH endonuclease